MKMWQFFWNWNCQISQPSNFPISYEIINPAWNLRESRKVEAQIVHIRIGEADWLDGRERLQDLGLCDSCDSLHDSLVTAYLGEVLGVLDTGREHSCICRASKHLEDRVSHTGEGLSQGSILSIKCERKIAVLNRKLIKNLNFYLHICVLSLKHLFFLSMISSFCC